MDKDRVIEKMKQLVAQAKELPRSNTNGIEFKRWESAVKTFLKRLGGDYLKEFEEIRFIPGAFTLDCDNEIFVEACMKGVEEAIAFLDSQIEDIRGMGIARGEDKGYAGTRKRHADQYYSKSVSGADD